MGVVDNNKIKKKTTDSSKTNDNNQNDIAGTITTDSNGKTKAIGKNSTASWIIEVKKEALLREQKRKLKQEREKMELEGKIQHDNKDKNITQPVIDNIGRNNIKKKALKVTINPEDKSTIDEIKL